MNTFVLKIIAITSMLMDHVGYVFFPEVTIFRIVGRLAFPIFCYTLVEGFLHTRDVKKYLIRLGIFAIISEVPFDLAFMGEVLEIKHQNVFFTLFFGVVMMWMLTKTESMVVRFAIAVGLTLVCRFLNTDYASTGLLMMFTLYMFRGNKKEQLILTGLAVLLMSGGIQLFSILALIPIAMHNHKLGPKMKMFFYLFYPAHLLVVYLISIVV